jgi:hypothetical protein
MAFPHFRVVPSAGTGRPKKTAQRAELLIEFEGYRTRKRGSKYKHFRADHPAGCQAAGVKTVKGLKEAILKAKRERRIERQGLELLLRDAAARALGINIHPWLSRRTRVKPAGYTAKSTAK